MENDSNFDEYRKYNEKEKRIYAKNQLSKLPIVVKIREFVLTDVLMGFDATSLYLLAMWHEQSKYSENGTS